MEQHTFRSRLAQLMQKCRKALRLYSSVKQLGSGDATDLSELQVLEWRQVNSELLRQLSMALSNPNIKALTADIFMLRDRFQTEWRMAEAEQHAKQKLLLSSGEKGDFIRAATLCRELVTLKARTQAAQAAYHEIEELLLQSKVTPPPAIELPKEAEVEPVELAVANQRGKVLRFPKVGS